MENIYIYIFLNRKFEYNYVPFGKPACVCAGGWGPCDEDPLPLYCGWKQMLFFFLMANYIEIRHPPPQPRKGMCEYVRVFPPGLPSLLGKKA